MKKLKQILPVLLALSILFVGCSKDEPAAEQPSESAISAKYLTEKIPTTLSKKSPETYAQIQSMVGMMSITDGFTGSKPGAKKTGKMAADGTQTYTYGNYSVTYTEKTEASKVVFEYVVKQNNVTFYTIKGFTNKDGNAGQWDLMLYISGAASTTVNFDWKKDGSNNFALEMKTSYNGQGTSRLVANIKNDGSGDLQSYVGGELLLKSVWDKNGSGTYTNYDTNPPTVTKF